MKGPLGKVLISFQSVNKQYRHKQFLKIFLLLNRLAK